MAWSSNPFDWILNPLGNLASGIAGEIAPDSNITQGMEKLFGGNIFDSLLGENGIISNPEGALDHMKNGNSNDVNLKIAEDNLKEQQRVFGIEDERYKDETAYNRALQERIFEREDTALERQAQSLSSMGINPLSQNMNGLGAGSVVGASTRQGETPQNSFQSIPGGISGLVELFNGVSNMQSQGVSRDSLRVQDNLTRTQTEAQMIENMRRQMDNLVFASENDIRLEGDKMSLGSNFEYTNQKANANKGRSETAEADTKVRDNRINEKFNLASDATPEAKLIRDTGSMAEKIVTKMADAVDDSLLDNQKDNWLYRRFPKLKNTAFSRWQRSLK